MSRLPPSTNHLSRGSLASVWFLGLYSLLELITGLIHFFLPDGGAGVIAGLDLSAGAARTNTHGLGCLGDEAAAYA